MDTPEFDLDDAFASLLAGYDASLAAGDFSTAKPEFSADLPDRVVERFHKARSCVDLLELAWPRSQSHQLAMPNTVGRFEIVRELGRGGFGIVYLALDKKLQRSIALKVQRPEAIISPRLRKRFIKEGQITAGLRHPNIASVHEVGEAGLRIWIATEHCDGGSLANWLLAADRKPSFHAVADFMIKLAETIAYSHQKGVLHRDLKPTNVLLQRIGCNDKSCGDDLANFEPKLIDFGLFKLRDGRSSETGCGAILGTPGYMAPEQAVGQLDRIGPTTDVYGLGAILYELLTGLPPFCGDNDMATLTMVAEGHVVKPRMLSPTIPRDLEAICLKCLNVEPKNRYPSAAALATDLRRFLTTQPTIARPLSPAQQLVNWTRRHPTVAGLIAVSLAASLAFLGLTALHIGRLQAAHRAVRAALEQSQANMASLENQEQITNQYLYTSRMRLAFSDLDWGDVDNVAELLAAFEQQGKLADLRGFEWYHIKHRLSGDGLTLLSQHGEVYSVAFSPTGEVLASGGQDGLIRLWNPATRRELMRIPAHASCVNSVTYSPDGQMLASAGCDHTIKLWEASTGQLLATLDGHPSAVECVAFAPGNSDLLASCGDDPVVRVWSLATGEVLETLDSHLIGVRAIAWAPRGSTLLVSGADSAGKSTACTWNVETGQVEHYPRWRCKVAVFSPTSGDACFGSTDATVRAIQLAPRQAVSFHGHHAKIESLAFSPNGRWLASGSDDATIRLWDFKTASCVTTLNGHRTRVQSLAFDPRGVRLASASFDGTVKIWNLNDSMSQRALEFEVQVSPSGVSKGHVALSSDLRFLASMSRQDQVSILRLGDGSVAKNLQVVGCPEQFAFLTGSAILAGLPLQSPNRLDAWDVVQQRQVRGFTAQAKSSRHFELSGDGRCFITIGEHAVVIFDTATGHELASIERPSNIPVAEFSPSLSFSPDRNHLAVCVTDGEPTWIIDFHDVQLRHRAQPRVRGISNRAEVILVEQRSGSMQLIDLRSGLQLGTLRHSTPVQDLMFSPDSKSLATCCADGSVFLWNVATGEWFTRLASPGGRGVKVQFSSDSRKLAAVIALESSSDSKGEQCAAKVLVWNGLDNDQNDQKEFAQDTPF